MSKLSVRLRALGDRPATTASPWEWGEFDGGGHWMPWHKGNTLRTAGDVAISDDPFEGTVIHIPPDHGVTPRPCDRELLRAAPEIAAGAYEAAGVLEATEAALVEFLQRGAVQGTGEVLIPAEVAERLRRLAVRLELTDDDPRWADMAAAL